MSVEWRFVWRCGWMGCWVVRGGVVGGLGVVGGGLGMFLVEG